MRWLGSITDSINGHSSILAWRMLWTEEPGKLQPPWGCKVSDKTECESEQLELCAVVISPQPMIIIESGTKAQLKPSLSFHPHKYFDEQENIQLQVDHVSKTASKYDLVTTGQQGVSSLQGGTPS